MGNYAGTCKGICSWNLVYNFFFLSGFSFTDTDDSQDSMGREGTIFYSTLPLPPAHEHSGTYLQFCMWDDCHIFSIATLVFTRLLLDEILPPYRITIWLIDEVKVCFSLLTWWFDTRFLLQQSWHRKPVARTRIDYRPCITSEPTKQRLKMQSANFWYSFCH